MSIPNLPVNFKDDILAASNPKRKYQQTFNSDGSVSLEDVTVYSQTGSEFGASQVNQTNKAINNIYSERILDLDELELVTEPGFFVDAQAAKEAYDALNSKMPTLVKINGNIFGIRSPHTIKIIGTKTFQGAGDYGQLFSQSELLSMLKTVDPSISSFDSMKCAIISVNGDSIGHHFYQPEWWSANAAYYQYYYPSVSGQLRSDFCVEYVTD